MTTIRIKIRSDSQELPKLLFDVAAPAPGQSFGIMPGVEVVHERNIVRHGLVESGIVIDLVLKIATGVATKVVADWIADALKARKAKATVQINDKVVDSQDRAAVSSALDDAAG